MVEEHLLAGLDANPVAMEYVTGSRTEVSFCLEHLAATDTSLRHEQRSTADLEVLTRRKCLNSLIDKDLKHGTVPLPLTGTADVYQKISMATAVSNNRMT